MLLRRKTTTLFLIIGAVALTSAIFAVRGSAPVRYRDSIAIVLRERGVVYDEIAIVACGGNPSACYGEIFGDVAVSGPVRAAGFFRCAQGDVACRLTIPALDIYQAPMPTLSGAETMQVRAERMWREFEVSIRRIVYTRGK